MGQGGSTGETQETARFCAMFELFMRRCWLGSETDPSTSSLDVFRHNATCEGRMVKMELSIGLHIDCDSTRCTPKQAHRSCPGPRRARGFAARRRVRVLERGRARVSNAAVGDPSAVLANRRRQPHAPQALSAARTTASRLSPARSYPGHLICALASNVHPGTARLQRPPLVATAPAITNPRATHCRTTPPASSDGRGVDLPSPAHARPLRQLDFSHREIAAIRQSVPSWSRRSARQRHRASLRAATLAAVDTSSASRP